MSVTTNVSNLVINKMTKQQYSGITPSDTELYFVVDDADYVQFTAVDDSVAPPISIAGGGTAATTTSQAITNLGIYPIGSIYLSTSSSFSPSAAFGGTWERIKDTFLLAAGDTYSGGSTGGNANHTLTVSEMPSHTHKMGAGKWNGNAGSLTGNASNMLFGPYDYGTQATGSKNDDTASTGGGQAFSIMPPYLAVYVWKRTA